MGCIADLGDVVIYCARLATGSSVWDVCCGRGMLGGGGGGGGGRRGLMEGRWIGGGLRVEVVACGLVVVDACTWAYWGRIGRCYFVDA